MTLLLASVRDLDEARDAATGGAALIDLKEPHAGALGAVPLATIREVVRMLREEWPGLRVSATIGDLPPDDLAGMVRMADRVGRCGVDYVKAGIAPGPHAAGTLARLAALPWQIVPVLLADDGLDPALVRQACMLGFPALMADTADKASGSLLDCVPMAHLKRFVGEARAHGLLAGLAGSLRIGHLPAVLAIAPDIAGFRTALCAGGRTGRLESGRVRAIRELLAQGASVSSVFSPLPLGEGPGVRAGATSSDITGTTACPHPQPLSR